MRLQMSMISLTLAILLTPSGAAARYPDLPRGITSFGAAIVGDWLYVYGGHFGQAHHYSNKSQSNELSRLNLRQPKGWEAVGRGPRLQGLAMVSHGGHLYRVGGFTAHNPEGDEHDLRSVDQFARYDHDQQRWRQLPPLPQPRSSHDAIVIGNKLYVAGGWSLGESSQWHTTAHVVDLTQQPLRWKPLPEPPFQRRALSLGHQDGKLYVLGGMQQKGGPTTKVSVLDLSTGRWSEGPSLLGKGMAGFGSSACNAKGRLYASTYDGKLQVLRRDGTKWQLAKTLREDRFFHRMASYQDRLILVGGASMQEGKRLRLEVVALSELDAKP